MSKNSIVNLDNWGKGLLVNIISKALSNDRDLTADDIEKLKEIKKKLQEVY